MVALRDDVGAGPLLLRRDQDRGAVHIGAGDEQDLVAPQSVEPREDVTGEVGTGQVAQVERAVRVRPRDADQDAGHEVPSRGDRRGSNLNVCRGGAVVPACRPATRTSTPAATIKRGSHVAARMVADRTRRVEISGIRRMFESAPPNSINLGLGEPDFDPPSEVVEALCHSVQNGGNHYGPSAGLSALRERIARRYVGRDPKTVREN